MSIRAAFPLADPERALAVAYAPAQAREALHALFALDERLGGIVASSTEPGIAAIKLAWWRDALTRLDERPAPAEPLLQAMAQEVLPRGVSGSRLAELETGWLALLEDARPAASLAPAGDRGALLFGAGATILGGSDPRVDAAGRGWGLVDRARREGDPGSQSAYLAAAREVLAGAPGLAWPPRLRALGMLATLARRDALRDTPAPRGSPSRVLRALLHRMTGY